MAGNGTPTTNRYEEGNTLVSELGKYMKKQFEGKVSKHEYCSKVILNLKENDLIGSDIKLKAKF